MWARLQLRIGLRDLLSGAFHCLFPGERAKAQGAVESYWGTDDALAAYSVRTGFETLLRAMDLKPGDEVVFSAMNIKGMVSLVRRLGLQPVPVDLDFAHAAPRAEALEKAISPRSKVFIAAPLFGSRPDLAPIFAAAKRHGLVTVEDCAQGFDGRGFKGHDGADVVMFSFGPLKVATALGGALIRVRDRGLREQMRALMASYPVQKNSAQLKRIFMFAAVKAAMSRPVMSVLYRLFKSRAGELEDRVGEQVRNVAPLKGKGKLQFQPSTAMLRLMARRIDGFAAAGHAGHARSGRMLTGLIADVVTIPATGNEVHNYWVFPVLTGERDRFVTALRERGFDAASLTRAQVIEAPDGRGDLDPVNARIMIDDLLILPCYPDMPEAELRREAEAVRAVAAEIAKTPGARAGVTGVGKIAAPDPA